MSFKQYIDKTVNWIMVLFFSILIVVVFSNVVLRYFFHNSLYWAGEMSRYIFVWMSLLGISNGVRKKAHLGIDFFVEKTPPKLKKAINLFVQILMILFSVFIILVGYKVYAFNLNQLSPALRIPIGFMQLAIPIGFLLVLIDLLIDFKNTLFNKARSDS